MASLTVTAYYTRQGLKVGAVVFAIYVFTWFAFWEALALYKRMFPPPPPAPTMAFGNLPVIKFPEQTVASYSYELQTQNLKLPTFQDRGYVYYYPPQSTGFLELEKAKKGIAAALKFTQEPTLSATNNAVYKWVRKAPSLVTLEKNIINGNFIYNYDWRSDPTILAGRNQPNEAVARNLAKQTLSSVGHNPEDLNYDKSLVSFWKSSGNDLMPAVSVSESDFVWVNLFRNGLEKFSIVTSDPTKGIVRILLTGSNDQGKRFVTIEYNYFPIDYKNGATYFFKDVTQAWKEVQENKGYVARKPAGSNSSSKVFIRRVDIAYYDDYVYQTYMQPIYVFSGDTGAEADKFVVYVPAIADKHIKK